MKVVIQGHPKDSPWSARAKFQMARAMEKHGDHVSIIPIGIEKGFEYAADVTVTWGLRREKMDIMRAQHAAGRRHLVMERGYLLDRSEWFSLAFDGLNGEGDFCLPDEDGSRWEKHFARVMQPWRVPDEGYVLIAGQVTGDAATNGKVDLHAWYAEISGGLKERGHAVKFRKHPLERGMRSRLSPDRQNGSLASDLAGAKWLVAYNSNSAVDAVMAGVPAVTCDRCAMSWSVTGRDPFTPPPTSDRMQWAHRLAWTQYRLEEFADVWDRMRVHAMEPRANRFNP